MQQREAVATRKTVVSSPTSSRLIAARLEDVEDIGRSATRRKSPQHAGCDRNHDEDDERRVRDPRRRFPDSRGASVTEPRGEPTDPSAAPIRAVTMLLVPDHPPDLLRVIPIARSMPSSRVRSNTLRTTCSRCRTGSPRSTAPEVRRARSEPCRASSSCRSRNSSRVSTMASGNARTALFERCGCSPRDATSHLDESELALTGAERPVESLCGDPNLTER